MAIRIRERHAVISSDMVSSLTMGVEWTISRDSIDSTNMEPRHWLGMAKAIKDNYESYDGFVILHGTDTMSYTGAALSYLIQNSAKPVVITGSQRPVSMEITDAKHNIYDSFLYACDDQVPL